MTRIFAAVLAIGLAFTGSAAPAFACIAPMSAGDCCPNGGSAPCIESDAATPAVVESACCMAVPGSIPAIYVSLTRAEHAELTGSRSLDLPILPSETIALAQPVALQDGQLAPATQSVRDGSHTYLHTLRLRL